jgi:hypothetical protein
MKKIFVLLLLVITSCGYQPLYKIDQSGKKIIIKEIILTGDNTLSEKISKKLSINVIRDDENLNKLNLNSQKNIIETSKNLKGQVTSYRTSLTVIISILDNEDNLVRKKNITKQFLYNVQENKFKFKQYQTEIENRLINQIVRDINIFLKF